MSFERRLRRFFDDRDRKQIRQHQRRSFIGDFFVSESTAYSNLRFITNSIFGLVVSILAYYLVWEKINFANFHPVLSRLFQGFMIFGNAFVFAKSQRYRCGLAIFLLGVFGTSGQNLIMVFVMDNAREGPIDNIFDNFRIATENIVCSVKISNELATTRGKVMIGPMREVLEREFSRLLRWKGKFQQWSCGGECGEVPENKEESEEEKQNRQIDQAALDLAQRAKLTNSDDGYVKFVRNIGEKMQEQCSRIFDKGTLLCHKALASLKENCRGSAPFLLTGLVCKPLDALELCEDDKRKEEGYNLCNEALSNDMPDGETIDMRNISKQVSAELETKLRIATVEAPRMSSTLHIKSLQASVKRLIRVAKELVVAMGKMLTALLIFVVYLTFKRGFRMVDAYERDFEYENRTITSDFWKIDRAREAKREPCLQTLTQLEMKQLGVTEKWLRCPKFAELRQMWLPLSKFTIFFVFIAAIFAIDHLLFRVMGAITGQGMFPKLLNNLFKAKNSTQKSVYMLEDCLVPPKAPDYERAVVTVFLPLAFMLICQVILSFLPKKLTIAYVLPFFFPRKTRARLIMLYNKCLIHRLMGRIEARRRIRFYVKWRKENEADSDDDGDVTCLNRRAPLRRKIIENLFALHECLLCMTHLRTRNTRYCSECEATFCRPCMAEMHNVCYACQAEKGLVNSTYTNVPEYLQPPPTSSSP
ncbi:unnamed protein product, partial [Mesorhabditis spiculigera]